MHGQTNDTKNDDEKTVTPRMRGFLNLSFFGINPIIHLHRIDHLITSLISNRLLVNDLQTDPVDFSNPTLIPKKN